MGLGISKRLDQQVGECVLSALHTTFEEVAAIKNGDMLALERFYFEPCNYLKFQRKAFRYLLNGSYMRGYRGVSRGFTADDSRYCYDDLMQQLFLDLPYLNYSDVVPFWRSVFLSFKRSPFGGILSPHLDLGERTLDCPVGGERSAAVMADFLVSSQSVEDEYFTAALLDDSGGKFCDSGNEPVIVAWLKKYLPFEGDFKLAYMALFRDCSFFDMADSLGLSRFSVSAESLSRIFRLLSFHIGVLLPFLNPFSKYGKFIGLLPSNICRVRSAMRSHSLRLGAAL
jgi:hypothetical protein